MKRIDDKKMNIPDFILPWLDRFYDPLEIEILQILGNRVLDKKEVIALMTKDVTAEKPEDFNLFFERARKRGVIKFVDGERVALEDFHVRFDFWALFEGWKDLPVEIKDKINDWELNDYIKSHGKYAQALKKGEQRDPHRVYPEYLLLGEVENLFKRILKFYLWPCNCRSMFQNCHQSLHTCIRFSNKRNIGWEISREKALAIVRSANKKGLMQSAELGRDEQGNITGALCNCCSDCCFPHQLSKRLDVIKFWPISRYVAALAADKCTQCGKCVRRCPFGIISQEKDTKTKKRNIPVIDTDLCRGCGVCSTECPETAIKMKRTGKSVFESDFQG